MFGKNVIRPLIYDPSKLAVQDVFYTLQGEGPYSGSPALFVRLAGCNLACTFCDTEFESRVDETNPWLQTWISIVERFSRDQRKFVVLTGGEPLRQNPVELITRMLEHGTELVQIETAGTVWQQELAPLIHAGRVVLVCSPKTPGVHPMIEATCQHWKYIIKVGEVDPIDGLPNRGTQTATAGKLQRIHRPEQGNALIWLSPCDEYDPAKNKANQDLARDLCLHHGYRLSLQTHKIVGVE